MTFTEKIHHSWRGVHTSRNGPKMRDAHIKVLGECKAQLQDKIAKRIDTVSVEYVTASPKLRDKGLMYFHTGEEAIKYLDEDSHTEGNGHWRGTVTVDLVATFSVRPYQG